MLVIQFDRFDVKTLLAHFFIHVYFGGLRELVWGRILRDARVRLWDQRANAINILGWAHHILFPPEADFVEHLIVLRRTDEASDYTSLFLNFVHLLLHLVVFTLLLLMYHFLILLLPHKFIQSVGVQELMIPLVLVHLSVWLVYFILKEALVVLWQGFLDHLRHWLDFDLWLAYIEVRNGLELAFYDFLGVIKRWHLDIWRIIVILGKLFLGFVICIYFILEWGEIILIRSVQLLAWILELSFLQERLMPLMLVWQFLVWFESVWVDRVVVRNLRVFRPSCGQTVFFAGVLGVLSQLIKAALRIFFIWIVLRRLCINLLSCQAYLVIQIDNIGRFVFLNFIIAKSTALVAHFTIL